MLQEPLCIALLQFIKMALIVQGWGIDFHADMPIIAADTRDGLGNCIAMLALKSAEAKLNFTLICTCVYDCALHLSSR